MRELLIQELDRLVADQRQVERQSLATRLHDGVSMLRNNVVEIVAQVPRLAEVPGFLLQKLVPPGEPTWMLVPIAVGLGLVFAVGFAAEFGFRRLVTPVRHNIERAETATASRRLGWLLLLIALDGLALLVLAIGSVAALVALYHGHEPVRILASILLHTILMVRAFILTSRFVLAPNSRRRRLGPAP